MLKRKLGLSLMMFGAAGLLISIASCQSGGNNQCETDDDCNEGEVCTFDSEVNGNACRDGSLFGL